MKTRLVVLLLLSMSISAITILPATASATTLYVGGAGPGNYTTIQGAIDDAAPGDSIYVYGGTYYEHLTISKPLSLFGEDRNTTIIDGGENGIVVLISANWVNITGLAIRNSGTSLELFPYLTGLMLETVRDCHITNSDISGNQDGLTLIDSSRITIADNVIMNNSKWGIVLHSSSNNTLANNDIHDNWESGILLVDSNDNTIAENDASDNPSGILFFSSSHNAVANNTVLKNFRTSVFVKISDGNAIVDNALSSVSLEESNDNMIDNNTMEALELEKSIGNEVANNTISTSGIAIRLVDSDSNTIAKNVISNGEKGVYLTNSSFNVISGNEISHGNQSGIGIYHSRNTTLTGNLMSFNGIEIRGDSLEHWNSHAIDASNKVNGKTVYYWKNREGERIPTDAGQVILANCTGVLVKGLHLANGNTGILLGFSSHNKIVENTVSNHKYVARLLFSDNNMVYHNNFMGTLVQAADSGRDNRWDNGYPSGGNYWETLGWTLGCIDQFRGPLQDEDGSDGICDRGKLIGESRDRYPLLEPYSGVEPLFIQLWFWIAIAAVVVGLATALILVMRRRKKE
ncbi:MAG: right-handed parallel beta-helix repeat-containing protein [Thermoplasmata archaeon]|nr:right-handed parallel beta-helix repeat-containing protein [Thermoplasmata archaeon]